MIRIGISGWTYAGWRGVFYPGGLAHRKELEFAADAFPTIEINGTHYSLQRPSSFKRWRDQTPPDFIFAVKAGRYITHMRRLRDIDGPLANFFASGILALGKKLGPILWQFPPNFQFDENLLDGFFLKLPRTGKDASKIASKHDSRLRSRAHTRADGIGAIRHCVEIRHPSFLAPTFFALLRRHKIAFVQSDSAGKFPYTDDVTSDFVYIRLHGAEELYVSGYSDAALDDWANRIRLWLRGETREGSVVFGRQKPLKVRDVFVYFDNDAKVMAPGDARRLAERLASN